MANKPITQILKHGTLLTKKAFPFFVEAWNWLFEDFVNMKGDFDLDPQNGHIQLDDAAGFPVLRLVNIDKLKDAIKKDIEDDDDEDGGGGDDDQDVVTSLNGETGAITIIGGKGIRVETDGKTIKISYDPNKDEEDEDPNAEKEDPCDHPGGGSGSNGGIRVEERPGGGGGGDGGGVGFDGGVPAEGDAHPGKPCTGETC